MSKARTLSGLALILGACAIVAVPVAAQSRPAVGDKAPVVMVDGLDGKPVAVGLRPGRHAAVVEFWATWCEICHELLPKVRAAQAKYGADVDFFGVDVTVNDPLARVKRFVADNKPPYTTVYDRTGAAVRAFGAMATSYVVIVGRDGRIAYTGDGSDQDLDAELARVVK